MSRRHIRSFREKYFIIVTQLYLFTVFLVYFFIIDNMQSELFVNRTVGQLLFEGYEDELLALAEMMGEKSRTPLDRFGYFYKVLTLKSLLVNAPNYIVGCVIQRRYIH